MMNVEPVVSILAAVFVLGETIAPLQWLGVAIMLAALCFSAIAGVRRRS
jgi:drug/metabolite transporter (DMT)-like permease